MTVEEIVVVAVNLAGRGRVLSGVLSFHIRWPGEEKKLGAVLLLGETFNDAWEKPISGLVRPKPLREGGRDAPLAETFDNSYLGGNPSRSGLVGS